MTRSPDRILDELLVLKCQDGDAEAFKKLVSRWHGRLRRHAWYLTHDADATGDIVQDAWLDIVRTIRRLKEPASFRGWAYRIVGNKAADWVRTKKRHQALGRAVARKKKNVTACPSAVKSENVQSMVRRGLRTLPAVSQQILSMKYLDRMSAREIAETLDIPVGTVKSRLYHAREQFKQVLQRIRTNNE